MVHPYDRDGWKADLDGAGTAREHAPMFTNEANARADMKQGTVYALIGENSWIYYGQVTADKSVGFFHRRDRKVGDIQSILSASVMCVIPVAYPSITRALRAGTWCKIGRYDLAEALRLPRSLVQWPVGTLDVTIWQGGTIVGQTRIDDPGIQQLELMAVWDAQYHIPERLTADFGAEQSGWHVGGPIWRERKVKEERARRFPDLPYHQLPADWVPVDVR
ncbi:hypothetical protein [Emcibacter sp. SYSU 3D8]|uniref:hypothetical protein n=1 Tax=Emcibacter sp. SYSU 3D8 TaxID=3133969 RepID=UPI0031FE94FF